MGGGWMGISVLLLRRRWEVRMSGQKLQGGQVTHCVSLHTSAEAIEKSLVYTT